MLPVECQHAHGRAKRFRPIEDKDRYGRTLGVIYTTDGTYNFNLGMVENGFAWHYVQYSKDQNYAAAEANARAKRLGLWADTQQPIPPWEFRANK